VSQDVFAEATSLAEALEIVRGHEYVAGPGAVGQSLPLLRQTVEDQLGQALAAVARRHVKAVDALPGIMTMIDIYSANIRAHDQRQLAQPYDLAKTIEAGEFVRVDP
jgi:hypothetical protein